MDVKNTHSVTKTEISVFGRQALDAERRRSPSLAGKVLKEDWIRMFDVCQMIKRTSKVHWIYGIMRTGLNEEEAMLGPQK